MKLSDITNRKFIESYPGNNRKISTPSGYKEILEVHKTIKYRKFKIELENGMFLEGAYNHVIIEHNGNECYIKDSLDKIIKTEYGLSRVVNVIDLNIEEHMYDITIDSEDELYYSNGVLSHNSGKSVVAGVYLLWISIFMKDILIGIAANKNSSAKEILNKIKNIYMGLPIWLQPGVISFNKTFIELENGVKILTDSTNGDSFRGYTVNCLFLDEISWIKPSQWEDFSDAVFPAQGALAWKKTILTSTMKGMNHWYHIVNKAKSGSGEYKYHFASWDEVPRYDKEGNRLDPQVFRDRIIDKHGILYWNQNYLNEAIGSSHTLIPSEKLKQFEPIEPELIKDGKLKIYHKPVKGHQYIMAVDPAKDGKDAFAVQIIDITGFKFKQVATSKLDIDYLLMPEFLNEWCELYFNPYLIIENNEGAGQSIADQMFQTYEYNNLHFDIKTEAGTSNISKSKKKYPGTRTTSKSRKQILQTMKSFIENDNIEINDKDTIGEFFTFVLDKGKYQADEGCHDDMIMSLALVFTIFNNIKNFHDMKEVTKLLFEEMDEISEVSVEDIISVGSFDDGPDDYENYQSQPNASKSYEEYLIDSQEGFI